eukprot:353839-Chlamydomonas_euryale.AAC.54
MKSGLHGKEWPGATFSANFYEASAPKKGSCTYMRSWLVPVVTQTTPTEKVTAWPFADTVSLSHRHSSMVAGQQHSTVSAMACKLVKAQRSERHLVLVLF